MHELIETYMVLANEQAAKWCKKRKIPFLSRVHEEPSSENTKFLQDLLREKRVFLETDRQNNILITPRDVERYLESMQNPEELYRASRIILPKMSKASYRTDSIGHF